MSKTEIIAELRRLSPEDRAEVQAKLDELAGEAWQDRGELSGADKQTLDQTLAAYEKSPDAGSSWEQVEARVQGKLRLIMPGAYQVIIRIEAEVDITDVAIWYHKQQTGLGQEFLNEIESAIAIAAENPFRFPCMRRNPEVRRVLMDRFPYRVFFIRRDDAIVVFRILHSARHDREWKRNIPDD